MPPLPGPGLTIRPSYGQHKPASRPQEQQRDFSQDGTRGRAEAVSTRCYPDIPNAPPFPVPASKTCCLQESEGSHRHSIVKLLELPGVQDAGRH